MLAMALLAACGESGEGARQASPSISQVDLNPSALKRLRLTDTASSVVLRACETAANRSSLTVACPRVIPAGADHGIQYAGRLGGRRGPADSYSIHLISASLRRKGSDPENPGHWALEAAPSVSTLRKPLIRKDQVRDCRRLRERGVSTGPGSCRPARHPLELNGIDVTEYRMPPYPTGGVHGGHLVFLWEGDRAAYLVSVHDPANRQRAVAMASALVADTASG